MQKKAAALSKPKEVFLSHSSKDRAFIRKLAKLFKRAGIPYWYSASHIAGAKQWHDEIGRALARCDWFIVVLSPHSVKSTWVKHELLYALNQNRYNERIVPLLHRDCNHAKLSWTLSQYEFVDFTTDFDSGYRQLLRIWGIR